jgi:oligopeptidase B
MRNHARLILVALAVAGCQTVTPPRPVTQPPVAAKIPHTTKIHGERLVDNYHWLRNRNSRQVRDYLDAENAYTDWFMKPTEALQQKLYDEMLGRIEETDASVPYRDGDYLYYSRTQAGEQYPIYCRQKGSLDAPEEITVDLNELGRRETFIDLDVYEVSDDGNLLAYSIDVTGSREYTLYVKDLRTGKLLSEKIPRVTGAVWAADNQTLFYITEDRAKRPYRLYRHTLGGRTDRLIYEEKDPLFDLEIYRSRSKSFIFVASGSHTADEVRFLPADRPLEALKIIAPREKDHEYTVSHCADRFYILTNDKGDNFRVATAPVTDPGRGNWTELVPHRDAVTIEDIELFAGHCVLLERENGLPQLRILDLRTGSSHLVEFSGQTFAVSVGDNLEFDTKLFRYSYESLTTPVSVFDYDMDSRERTLLKQQPVKGGYDPGQYETERVFARAADGARIPVSLVYRKGLVRDGRNPLLLEGYGAYGLSFDVWFSSEQLSLLNRGVVYAIAHVRGGGDLGKQWHDAGRMMNKRNTFTDFIAAAEFLVAQGYTSKTNLVITGGSAGGLLIGAVLNMRPDLFRAALVDVPFVDVLNTMLDPSLPLTVTEFEEWGDPRIRQQYRYMKTYSPYDNIAPTNYPALLVQTSLNDSLVMYWEPAKYVAKLRATKTDSNPLLLKINMAGGHSGQSGRYDRLRERAFEYAFLLWQWGIEN